MISLKLLAPPSIFLDTPNGSHGIRNDRLGYLLVYDRLLALKLTYDNILELGTLDLR